MAISEAAERDVARVNAHAPSKLLPELSPGREVAGGRSSCWAASADARIYYPGSTVLWVHRINPAESAVGLSAPPDVAESTLLSWYEAKVASHGWGASYVTDHLVVARAPNQPGARMIVLATLDLGTMDGRSFVRDYWITYNDPLLWVPKQ